MTKKHFTAIAAILCDQQAGWHLINQLATVFATCNPRFNRQKFIDAAWYYGKELPLVTALDVEPAGNDRG